MIFNWINNSNEETYKRLRMEKEKIGEEIKETMNFYQAKAILDRFALSHDMDKSKEKSKSKGTKEKGTGIEDQTVDDRSEGDVGDHQQQHSNQLESERAKVPIENTQNQNQNQQPLQPLQPILLDGIPIRPPYIPYQPKWYDRILDLLVGEDEQSPNSRYALICANCRMHNGLAQFGEKPQTVVYYCPHCGYKNGKEPDAKESDTDNESDKSNSTENDEKNVDDVHNDNSEQEHEEDTAPIETTIDPKPSSPNPVRQRKTKKN